MTTICFKESFRREQNIMSSYSCLFCDSFLDLTFFMCSNLHFCCHNCRLLGGFCPDCHVMQILCCSLSLYESAPKGPLFNEAGGTGPIISLPEANLESKELCLTCPSCENNEAMPSRLFNCPDCGRFLSSLWLVEHYQRDHPNTHVCPVPPGGCLSFKLKLDDIEVGKMKRLQVIKIISSDWLNQREKIYEQLESEEKILFVMATRTYFFNSKTVLLLWLASCFQACLMTYTIEARGEKNNYASALYTGSKNYNDELVNMKQSNQTNKTIFFTKYYRSEDYNGNPVGPKIMEEVAKGTMKYEEIGQCLAIKDSLVRIFENEGNGVVINILIYKNI